MNVKTVFTILLGLIMSQTLFAQQTEKNKSCCNKSIQKNIVVNVQNGAFLGVNLGDDEGSNGVKVEGTIDGGAAKKAGIEANDFIKEFNGKKVSTSNELKKLINESKPNDKVIIKIDRNGSVIEKEVMLGSHNNNMTMNNFSFPNNILSKIPQMGDMDMFNSKPTLGVHLQELNSGLAKYFGTTENGGALVSEVVKGSPAEKFGLESGDVITSIDGNKISTTKDVVKFIGNKKESEKISIGILRDKFTKSIDVVLEKGAQNKECMNNIFNFKFDDSKESNDENIEDLDLNGLFNFNGDMLNFKEGEEVDFSKMRIFTDSAKIDLNNLKPQLEKLSKEMKNLKNSFNIKDEDINLEGLNLDEIGKALENTEIKVWHGGDKNSQAVAISIKGKKTKKDTKVKENNKIENPVPGAKSDLD